MQKNQTITPESALAGVPAQWGKLDDTGAIIQPDFARWKICINYSNSQDIRMYKPYYSYDWQWERYDEREGLRVLVNRLIIDRPKWDIRWAKIYMNATLDLSTRTKNYDYCIASFKGHTNYMPRYRPVFYTDEKGFTRLNITESLLAYREMKEKWLHH